MEKEHGVVRGDASDWLFFFLVSFVCFELF